MAFEDRDPDAWLVKLDGELLTAVGVDFDEALRLTGVLVNAGVIQTRITVLACYRIDGIDLVRTFTTEPIKSKGPRNDN